MKIMWYDRGENRGGAGVFVPFAAPPGPGRQLWSGTYSRMSSTRQPRISHRVFRVVVVMALPCFMRWRVLAVTPCLKIR